jgi:hypothetical protein
MSLHYGGNLQRLTQPTLAADPHDYFQNSQSIRG